MDVAYQTQTNVADASREFQMQKAAFDQEVNTKKADAELAYELQVEIILFYTLWHQLLVMHLDMAALQVNHSAQFFYAQLS